MIIRADARRIPLADGVAQCVITSPPYWGLRCYSGVADSIWGGDAECRHEWTTERLIDRRPYSAEFAEAINASGMGPAKFNGATVSQGRFCACGAWRGQLGLEPRPEMFVAHLVEIFREVRRVLRDDGVCFLNIGDSYFGSWANSGCQSSLAHDVLKPKDLCLIPFRLAIALQEDGWWVRDDIVWAKRASMPESVADRCTRAHEYILHLSKGGRYYWNADAIAEPLAYSSYQRMNQPSFDAQTGGLKDYGEGSNRSARRALRNLKNAITPRRDGERWNQNDGRGFLGNAADPLPPAYRGSSFLTGKTGAVHRRTGKGPRYEHSTRNKRDVWFLAAEPNRWALCRACRYVGESWPDCARCGGADDACARCQGKRRCPLCGSADITAHFAAFPSELPETCILAGSRLGDIVLDPFLGTGTTLVAAERLGRRGVGLEMSEDYISIAQKRTAQRGLFSWRRSQSTEEWENGERG